MSTIGNVLRDADPIRTEPAVSSEQREAVRRAVVEAALRPIPDAESARFRFVRLAAALLSVLFASWFSDGACERLSSLTPRSKSNPGLLSTPPVLAPGLPGFPAVNVRHSVQSDPDGKNNFVPLQGVVYDEQGKLAQGVEVRIHRLDAKGDFKTETGKAGRYSYTEIPPGDYVMGILQNGDIVLIRVLTLRAGSKVQSDFDLTDLERSGATMKAAAFDLLTKEEAERIVSTPDAFGGGGFGGGGGDKLK